MGFGGLCLFFLGMATLKRVQVFCRYGNPVESPVCGFYFLFAWMGDGEGGGGRVGEAGDSQFGVGDMWRVYVECVLLMAGLQPHLA